jgi:nucleotide-binding universal stress UspA family protein
VGAPSRIHIKHVLLATDFSEASHKALTFAVAVARAYGATVHALHVVTPEAYLCATPENAAAFAEMEESLQSEMAEVSARLSGLTNDTAIERSTSVLAGVEDAIERNNIDLVVVGTQGRTGVRKLLMGSTAEAIFRQARVPVLTIGPAVRDAMHSGGKFRSVLFATDLTEISLSAASFAFSIAEDNDAKLTLLHVSCRQDTKAATPPGAPGPVVTAAGIMHILHEMIPVDADLWNRPEVVLKFGEPAKQILETATEKAADLIVMGPRSVKGPLASATHLSKGVSYNVTIRSRSPVLTVRA